MSIVAHRALSCGTGRNARRTPATQATRRKLSEEYASTKEGYDKISATIDQWARDRQAATIGRQVDFTDIRDARDFADWAVVNGVPALGTMLGAFAVGYAGGPPALWAYGTAMAAGEMFSEADLTAADDRNAVNRILLFSTLSGAVELTGAAPRALRPVWREAYKGVSRDVQRRVAQGYARRLGREAIGSGLEEFMQEGAQFFLEQAGVQGSDLELTDELLLGAFNAGMVGLLAGGAFGTAFNIRQQVALEKDAQRKRDAGLTVRSIEELAAVTEDLKLPTMAPKAFRSLADKLGPNNMKLYYQADAIQQYVTDKGADLEQTLHTLGVQPSDFMQALATGTRIPVTGSGLVQIGLTNDADVEFWAKHAASRPDGDSVLDLEQMDEQRKEVLARIREEVEVGALSPTRQQLIAQISDQIVAAGRSPEEAGVQATALAAAFETHAELLAVALNTGNEDNMNRLVNGTHMIKFTEENVQALLNNHMTETDWRFVQGFWDLINSYWGEIAANERRLTGVYPTKVEAKMGVNAPSFVRGGYYPIRYDPRLAANVDEFSQNEVFENLRTGRMSRAQTKHGHVEERQRAVGKPLYLSLSVGVGHINDVLFDLELREPVQSAWRLLNDKDVSEAFKTKGLEQDRQALIMWLQDVAIGDRQPVEGVNVLLRHLRSRLSIAKMGFSMTTLIQQPLGLLQSGVVVGNRDLFKGAVKYLSDPRRYLKAALEASPFMVERWRTFERDMAVVSGMIDEDPVYSKWTAFHRAMVQAAFLAIQTSQFYVVDMPTWVAAYDQFVQRHGTSEGAVDYADQLLARAQGSGLLSDRTAIERGHLSKNEAFSEFARFATTFGSYMIGGKLNVAIQEIRSARGAQAAGAATVRLVYNLLILYAAESLLSQLFTGRWPDDDDDDENLLWWMTKEVAFGAMGSVPLLRDTVGSLEGFDAGGAQGQAIVAPANILKGLGRIGSVAFGEGDEDGLRTGIRDLIKGTSILA